MSQKTDNVNAGAAVVTALVAVLQLVAVLISFHYIQKQLDAQNAQLQQQTDLTKAANAQALVGLAMPSNLQEIEHPEVAKLWIKGEKKGAKFNEVEADQYETLLATELTFHENVFIQCKNKLLDDEIYTAWDEDLKDLVKDQQIEGYWDRMRWAYHEMFRKHVDELIHAKQGGSEPQRVPQPCTKPPATTP